MSTKITLTPHQSKLYSCINNLVDAQKSIATEVALQEISKKSPKNTPKELKAAIAQSLGHRTFPSDLSYATIAYSIENYPSIPSSKVLQDIMLDPPHSTSASQINPDLSELWYNIANASIKRINAALSSVCESIDSTKNSEKPPLKPEKVTHLMQEVILPDLSLVMGLVTELHKLIVSSEQDYEKNKKNFADTAQEILNLLPKQELLNFIRQLPSVMTQVDKVYKYTLTGNKKNNEVLDNEIKDIISEGTVLSVLVGYIDKYETGNFNKEEYFKEITKSLLEFTLSFNAIIQNAYYEQIDVKAQVMVNYFNLSYLDVIIHKNDPKVASAIQNWLNFMLTKPTDYYSDKNRPKFFDAIPSMSNRALGYFLSELEASPAATSYINRDVEQISKTFDKKTKKEDLIKIKWPRLACLEGITRVELSAYNSTNKVIDFIATLLKTDFEQGRTFCAFFDQEIKAYLLKNKATLHQDVLVSILKYSQAQKTKYKTLEAVCDDFGQQITQIEKEYMEKEIQNLTSGAGDSKNSKSEISQSVKKFKI